ncbi:uncharacterized protein Z518_02815 [Rhinocladiella mackenziei CBS 650.93]|uniref:Rhinocladiella mackenziei CBS 650.93 unplaced genomic scaffold supercont1.2, whole genome shotgun sequence n=1 Tax=Rhinocladiella mackenziei CBS 650.93 TaxID=1442369 RepID=A0A0D2IQF4_9EURO|nr:uncharacterized protein Z518_02815 [Rhinocladiella mackenziei CBS 650.93]KIX08159.1 hypothetical protein Z518_02815 [Rhinocladiella mackenziei CBS 650.93]
MSVEAPKPVEETPVVDATKAAPEQPEASTAPAETSDAPAETTDAAPTTTAAAAEEPAAAAAEDSKKDEAVEAVPASEGVLAYKEPTLFKKFFFTKHFFWFSEEPSTAESLTTYARSDRAVHASAAWARETGKGLLFFAKRAEDKATPVGVISLADASAVTKEGHNQFSFKAGTHQHRFEVGKPEERDSWIVAIEKAIKEAKELKDEITGRESYKKNVEEYAKPPVFAAAAAPVKTPHPKPKEPKKSTDASAATAEATTPAAENGDVESGEADEATKAKKERSQSRKRGSIFGALRVKKEEHAEKKEESKAEAEGKKEEAKPTEEAGAATEAAETSAAGPAAASDKKEEKEAPSPTEKKNKRGSVFGNLFKKGVTSPTAEKTEKEATATKDADVPPVSENAPKIEEPIENKPIDAAAVTAPANSAEKPAAEEPAATSAEAAENAAAEPAAETSATTTTEERPARDNKRRTSLFFNKKKPETGEGEDGAAAESKREKSPIPGGKFIGQLVRRASKAVKSEKPEKPEGPKEKTAAEPAATAAATAETPETVPEAPETKTTDAPEDAPKAEPVTPAAPEVKATA